MCNLPNTARDCKDLEDCMVVLYTDARYKHLLPVLAVTKKKSWLELFERFFFLLPGYTGRMVVSAAHICICRGYQHVSPLQYVSQPTSRGSVIK